MLFYGQTVDAALQNKNALILEKMENQKNALLSSRQRWRKEEKFGSKKKNFLNVSVFLVLQLVLCLRF